MANPQSSIFNKKATEKLRSPDDLDKYVRVTNLNVWVILIACVALLAGLLSWGIFGAVTTSVSATGVCVDGKAMCFLPADDAAKVSVDDTALVGDVKMQVSEVATLPVSRNEAASQLKSDYLVSTLVKSDWACRVDFSGDTTGLDQGIPLTVEITVDRVSPISLIMKNWG